MPSVGDMVSKVVANGQPALGLTDHGNMSGAGDLYKACRAADIVPFPGEEFYLVHDVNDKDAQRYHIIIMALDYEGYKVVLQLSSRSHQRDRFHRKPRIDFNDLKAIHESGKAKHVAVLTGCYFGLVVQTLVTKQSVSGAAKVAKLLASWFPHTYIEVQHHNTDGVNEMSDNKVVDALLSIANTTGIRPIITQDAHYCDLKHKSHHDLMKRVGYYGAASDSDEKDWTFPGDGYHLARTEWVRDHYEDCPRVWEQSQESYTELLSLNKLRIPVLDQYSYHIPTIVNDPMRQITRRCHATLETMGLDRSKRHVAKMEEELSIIEAKGFASYFVLVVWIVDYCREHGIRVSARGSAGGSIVCWLLGITQLDPIRWKLDFTRFLSLDRERPPDIDLDIDKFRREEVLDAMAQEFDTIPIGTYGTLGQDAETGKGSMFVLFMQYERNRLGKEEFNRKYGGRVKGMADLPRSTQRKLYALADMGVYKHHGTHAAGIVVTDKSYPIDDLLSRMLVASTGKTVTQQTMESVEDFGFVKVDMLGLRAEYTVARCLELLGKSPIDEMGWIPLDDSATFTLIRKGDTGTGVFTFEGYTQAKGAKEVSAKSIEDLILVNALYRPATMNGGLVRDYLNRKGGRSFEYLDGPNGLFAKAFGNTYGIPVYQEQVMDLLRLLGYPQHDLNKMLKAIKASNNAEIGANRTFNENEQRFIDLCIKSGMTDAMAEEAWELVRLFSAYSFNRAHAAEYAMRGYQMAYLKVHYPLEFHTALLEGTSMAGDDEKEKVYAREARRRGIRLISADVSVSNSHWTMDKKRGAIRRGLTSIKGIGDSVAAGIIAARPFTTIEEMLEGSKAATGRAMPGGKDYLDNANYSGAVLALKEAGALRSLGIE